MWKVCEQNTHDSGQVASALIYVLNRPLHGAIIKVGYLLAHISVIDHISCFCWCIMSVILLCRSDAQTGCLLLMNDYLRNRFSSSQLWYILTGFSFKKVPMIFSHPLFEFCIKLSIWAVLLFVFSQCQKNPKKTKQTCRAKSFVFSIIYDGELGDGLETFEEFQ